MIDLTKKYVTRGGKRVIALYHIPEAHECYRILAVVEGASINFTYYEDGKFNQDSESGFDLLLAPTMMYASLYRNRGGIYYFGGVFRSRKQADGSLSGDRSLDEFIKTIEVEV